MTTGLSQSQFFHDEFLNESASFRIVVSCASGFEVLLFDELVEILADILPPDELKLGNACVEFQGNTSILYRICLWSRLAEQVLVNLAHMQILEKSQSDARELLYKEVKSIPWQKFFTTSDSFKIDSSGKQTVFDDERFAALVCKDAIADCFRFHYEKRPSVAKENADIVVQLFGDGNHFRVQLNISGERLHKRGYRLSTVEAPLRETLAAALLRQINWHKQCRQLDYFLDPCCGSGTLVIEALLMAADSAPGLFRAQSRDKFFAFEKLAFFEAPVWTTLCDEAQTRQQAGLEKITHQALKFRAYDSDIVAIKACRENLDHVNLLDYVHVEKRAFAHLAPLKVEGKNESKGMLLCNPPYGERLQEASELKYLYRFLGERFREHFNHWHVGVISSQVELLDALALTDFQQARFYNGNLKCIFRYACIDRSTNQDKLVGNYYLDCLESTVEQEAFDERAMDFKNRLVKNLRKLKPWLKKSAVQQFRLYDADIPEFNIAIDAYQEAGAAFLMVSEYAPPKTVDEAVAKERFNLALQTLRTLFKLHREQIYIKTRRRQKGSAQYHSKSDDSKTNNKPRLVPVTENGLKFLLNPTDYLDTGLFLDHRLMRKRLFDEARGKRFLNLFCYTGSATVYAAAGGAKSSLSVDLSANYLSWACKNLLVNGFSLDEHRTKAADVMSWLLESKEQYDLIFIDPPTFSNTKKKGLTFDVQSDHERLIERALARLDGQGSIYFSCNFRHFSFSEKLINNYRVKEISKETQSPDFSRKQAHRSWLIQKNS